MLIFIEENFLYSLTDISDHGHFSFTLFPFPLLILIDRSHDISDDDVTRSCSCSFVRRLLLENKNDLSVSIPQHTMKKTLLIVFIHGFKVRITFYIFDILLSASMRRHNGTADKLFGLNRETTIPLAHFRNTCATWLASHSRPSISLR